MFLSMIFVKDRFDTYMMPQKQNESDCWLGLIWINLDLKLQRIKTLKKRQQKILWELLGSSHVQTSLGNIDILRVRGFNLNCSSIRKGLRLDDKNNITSDHVIS